MKTPKNEGEQQNKPVTRYDQKLEKRKRQAKEEARKDRIFSLTCIGIVVLFIAAVAGLFATSSANKNRVIKETYVKIGTHEITQLEYDYYYNMITSNYINSYGSIMSYMGIGGFDPQKDYSLQQYSETMTWKDFFDEMAITQLKNVKAMSDDAGSNGFVADISEDYAEYMTNLASYASTNGISEAQYYKAFYGQYATKENMEPFIKENLMMDAYYDSLVDRFGPSEDEINTYYEENKNNYDTVNYRSFAFVSDVAEDATEEQKTEAMQQLKIQADQMAERRNAGEDFNALCIEYAAEGDKEKYQDSAVDASMVNDGVYAYTSTYYRDWLYDDARKATDVTVVADEAASTWYVVEFVEKIKDENASETIKQTLADEDVTQYVTSLIEQYEVVDVAGDLVYLTIPETTAAETEAAEEAGTESTEAAAETEAGQESTEASAETETEQAETESAAESTETTAVQ